MSDAPPALVSAVPPLPEGWHFLKFKVLTGSRLAVVGASADVLGLKRSDRASGESWRLAAQATARVWTVLDDTLIEELEFPLLEPFPVVDQFPDGRWLVATSRSRGSGNARILGAGGVEERRIELGDGIQHVKVDDHGRIWVGWFDEGVFGNDAWRVPGLKRAPSAHGIAAFDDKGTLITHATLDSIADCYALNVSGSEAWACTYVDFPIWRMTNEEERTWPTALSGTSAIAVSDPYVLAAGGYSGNRNKVVLLRLDEQEARSIREWRMPFPADRQSKISLMDGRGDELHIVHDQQWHRWRVADFVKLAS